MVGRRLDAVQRGGQVVEVPAQRAGHRLGLVVVPQAGQIAPATVAAQFDQPRAELDPEQQPAQQPERQDGRRDLVVAEERGEQAGLQQQRLPSEGVPGLPDVDDRQVEHPQQHPEQHRRPERYEVAGPGQHGCGERAARPGDGGEEAVGVAQVEQARRVPEPRPGEQAGYREHPVLTDQGPELAGGGEEPDQVDGGQHPLDEQSAQPVLGRREPLHAACSREGGRSPVIPTTCRGAAGAPPGPGRPVHPIGPGQPARLVGRQTGRVGPLGRAGHPWGPGQPSAGPDQAAAHRAPASSSP